MFSLPSKPLTADENKFLNLHLSLQYGKRRLTVDVDYKRVPLGYKYLEQYHGFKHPLAGTGLENSYGYKKQVWY